MDNGQVSYNRSPVNGRYPVGTEVYFSCNPGYSSTGPSSMICESSGNWSLQAPTCMPIGTQLCILFLQTECRII